MWRSDHKRGACWSAEPIRLVPLPTAPGGGACPGTITRRRAVQLDSSQGDRDPCTVGALGRPMNVDDRLSQDLVVEVTARRRPVTPRIEARTRNTNEDTEPRDRILADILGDEPSAHLLVSQAKHAAAFRRISRSIRNSRFSLPSRSNSTRSPTSNPDSTSRRACLTQAASDPSAIPRDRATPLSADQTPDTTPPPHDGTPPDTSTINPSRAPSPETHPRIGCPRNRVNSSWSQPMT